MDKGRVGDGKLEESGGARSTGTVNGDAMFAVGSCEVTQVLGCLADTGEGEGALSGCCSAQSSQVVEVVTRFSPDGLEFAHS